MKSICNAFAKREAVRSVTETSPFRTFATYGREAFIHAASVVWLRSNPSCA